MTLVACSLVVLSAVRGRAGTLWDIDLLLNPKDLSRQTTMYTGCFDITGKYNPALERLTYAQVWFPVSDEGIGRSRPWRSTFSWS